MISEVVQDFCKQYGLTGVSMEEGGSLGLSIESVGDLQLLHKAPKFLMGLNRKVENLYLLDGRKILACCHYRVPHPKPLHAQLRDGTLGLYYIFEEREVDATLLSRALDSLTDTMDSYGR